MKNPWESLDLSGPEYVLEEDKNEINNFNIKNKVKDQFIQTSLLPEAYLGNPKADIVLLHANPGYVKQELDYNGAHKKLFECSLKNMKHEEQEYPIYLLDDAFGYDAGYMWWVKQTSELREIGGLTQMEIANGIFQVEYFPYHSKNVVLKNLPRLSSQEYSFYLVKEAMKRNAIIIQMRGFGWSKGVPTKGIWIETIPELEDYQNYYRSASNLAAKLSRKNLGEDLFELVVRSIKSKR